MPPVFIYKKKKEISQSVFSIKLGKVSGDRKEI